MEVLFLKDGEESPSLPEQVVPDHYELVGSVLPVVEYDYPLEVVDQFSDPTVAKEYGLRRELRDGDVINVCSADGVRLVSSAHLLKLKGRLESFKQKPQTRRDLAMALVPLVRRFGSFYISSTH